ncbi:MORC family CW-type zinc finger protein 3 [Silurus asotus]|uniref:MORC family CW-type zinc finger protein 3 n=1 Tax=Silurus asotus TaxID=30991 RepID=A0AAD5FLD3_SILAS|nr:MORC family CW-type zinc finger protein 3 [Silurus asotus]
MISPQYLHTISTCHPGPFSAVAQLIDNAYDPDVKAKKFWIDKTLIKDQDCLIFMDNGKGMDYDTMHQMLSFGFSKKKTVRGHAPVGLYGNGFKSGSMRLGKDAIVFSNKASKIATPEHAESLQDILKYSLFNTKEELLTEFNVIKLSCDNSSGTRIIIWNLRRTSSGKLEFDLMKDRYDFQIPTDVCESYGEENMLLVPKSEYSLRAHSTQGMAASTAWSAGVSFQDICKAAGWSTPLTFVRFYYLDIRATPSFSVLHAGCAQKLYAETGQYGVIDHLLPKRFRRGSSF